MGAERFAVPEKMKQETKTTKQPNNTNKLSRKIQKNYNLALVLKNEMGTSKMNRHFILFSFDGVLTPRNPPSPGSELEMVLLCR